MSKLALLLRGINVGGNSPVSMSVLRQDLEALGYQGVRTHLQSGNAVISTRRSPTTVAAEVERSLRTRFSREIRVLTRTHDELADVVRRNPLREVATNPSRYIVLFLSSPAATAVIRSFDPKAFAPDVFRFDGKHVYIWYPEGMGRSKLATMLTDKRLGVVSTARNWNTVTKLLEMTSEVEPR